MIAKGNEIPANAPVTTEKEPWEREEKKKKERKERKEGREIGREKKLISKTSDCKFPIRLSELKCCLMKNVLK